MLIFPQNDDDDEDDDEECDVTLCGRMLSSSAPDIPDFSNSAFASALLFPFIRASVWARKLDNSS